MSRVSIQSSYITWGSNFTGVRGLPLYTILYYDYLCCAHAFYELASQNTIYFVSCSQCIWVLKDFWRNVCPSREVLMNGPQFWVLWRTAGTRDVSTTLIRHSIVYGWPRIARNWSLAIVFSDQQMYKTMCGCSTIDIISAYRYRHIASFLGTIRLYWKFDTQSFTDGVMFNFATRKEEKYRRSWQLWNADNSNFQHLRLDTIIRRISKF